MFSYKEDIHGFKNLLFPHNKNKNRYVLTALAAIPLFSLSIHVPAAVADETPYTPYSIQTEYEEIIANAQTLTVPDYDNSPILIERDEIIVTEAPKPVVKARPAPNAAVVGEAQAYARTLVPNDTEWNCLYNLWARESGWRVEAYNASSGATGIPQALPGSKMASAGADWETNPVTQINWGMGYIAGRYGTPCGAWAHSEEVGWY